MIKIEKKTDCCGCSACVQICPQSCIHLNEDLEGFLYPKVDKSCIQCGLCNKVCPIENPSKKRVPIKVYASINKNEVVRLQSSSGGIFGAIAEYVISKKHGVVFGAMFNESWDVVHGFTETLEGLHAFRGSKYVQSNINDSFKKVDVFLKQNRFVLFSGTPCQVHALLLYLRKDYRNLLTVDFACHGVPSPKIWKMFLNETRNGCKGNNIVPLFNLRTRLNLPPQKSIIEGISFRDKRLGWKKFSFALTFVKSSDKAKNNSISHSYIYYYHPYMMGFLTNLYVRPSCFDCKVKSFSSGSDITLADFWGIQNVYPELDDDKGISAVMLHTQHAVQIYSLLPLDNIKTDVETFIKYNAYAVKSAKPHPHRKDFFNNLEGCKSLSSLILLYTLTRKQRVKRIIKLMLNKCKLIEL